MSENACFTLSNASDNVFTDADTPDIFLDTSSRSIPDTIGSDIFPAFGFLDAEESDDDLSGSDCLDGLRVIVFADLEMYFDLSSSDDAVCFFVVFPVYFFCFIKDCNVELILL